MTTILEFEGPLMDKGTVYLRGPAMRVVIVVLLLAFGLPAGAQVTQVSIEDFVKFPDYSSLRLSPDGKHIAVTAPHGDSNMLVILDISDPDRPAVVSTLRPPAREGINAPLWVNEERLVFTTTRQIGALLAPRLTGKIYGINLDGSKPKQIYGMVEGASNYVFRYASIINRLADDPRHILVAGYTHDREYPLAERINVYTGRKSKVTVSPLRRGGLV